MHEETFRALEGGGTVITASRRLARVLTQSFHERQRRQARPVWRTPDILPLGAFVERAWHDWLLAGRRVECPTLLDSLQEQVVWEQVIRESPAGESLLRIPETARQAMDAWALVRAYRLPMDGRFEASEDWAAFAGWSRDFRKRCAAKDWMEPARLSDFVAELIREGEIRGPDAVLLAGFDQITPQQASFFKALGECGSVDMGRFEPAARLCKLPDAAKEIRAAADWAREKLEGNPEAEIGVIVPGLERARGAVERIFREVLDPGGVLDDRKRSFHLSLGPPLSQYPLVHAALLLIEFGLGRLELPQAGVLLRSPFLSGAEDEWTRRASLDTKFRRDGVWDVTLGGLMDAAVRCPKLQRALGRFENRLAKIPREQSANEWSRDFSMLLEAAGWPGDRTLSSREHQVVEEWYKLLSSFAGVDAAAPPMDYETALARVRRIASEKTFQVENEGAPVQIMGLLEASGLRFDHLWVMGLHDEALPSAAKPNPFLPGSLQKEYGLPHASAEHELEVASKLLAGLLASAPEVMLSYPATEGDRMLAPSPLLAGVAWEAVREAPQSSGEWIASMRAGLQIDELQDEKAPAVAVDAMQPGGASLFKDMAACPFKAFAVHRLGARPLEEAGLGPSPRDRGNGVHKALELIWTELGSQARLIGLEPAELQDVIARGIEGALERAGSKVGYGLERRRLQKLLGEWLELEKSRAPFEVVHPEKERVVTLGGLQVRTRADRIDELEDGRQVILDYKTGQVKWTGWGGDRPDEPQLPLYCATSERAIAGAAFVLICTGELAFRGLTAGGIRLPEMKEMKVDPPLPLGELIIVWKVVLERLAENFRAGHARVDPKLNACEYCGQRALCRIRELENARG